MPLVVLVGNVKRNSPRQLGKFDVENLARAGDDVVAAGPGGHAAEHQHMPQVVEVREVRDAVAEIAPIVCRSASRATSPSIINACTCFSRSGSGMSGGRVDAGRGHQARRRIAAKNIARRRRSRPTIHRPARPGL